MKLVEIGDKIINTYIKIGFIATFLMTGLYMLYEPFAEMIGTEYKVAWVFGAAFGVIFAPAATLILRPIIDCLYEKNILK